MFQNVQEYVAEMVQSVQKSKPVWVYSEDFIGTVFTWPKQLLPPSWPRLHALEEDSFRLPYTGVARLLS